MGYLDSLPGGMQSAYGGYSQLYRKPQYTQIGQTRVSSPTKLPLGQGMYGSQGLELPSLPEPAPYSIPESPDTIPDTQYDVDYEQALQESGNWEQYTVASDNSQLWFPSNAQQGQQYTDIAGGTWVRWGNTWLKTIPDEQGGLKFADAEDQPIVGAAEIVDAQSQGDIDAQIAALEQEKALLRTPAGGGAPGGAEAPRNAERIREIDEEIDRLRGLTPGDVPAIDTSLDTLANYEDTLENLIESLNDGDLTFDPLTGQLTDAEGNIIEGAMSTWLSGMMAESYKTGDIAGALYEVDEDGNITMSQELQDLMDSYSMLDERTQGEMMEFNRQMAAHSLASGQSLNSGYYSEHVANVMADRSMKVTSTFSEQIGKEMQDQYSFIAESLSDIMKSFMSAEEVEAFNANMATQKDAIDEMIRQQSELLAASIAEADAAKTGQIITAIFTLIIGFLL